jgi:hypothetical protein
MPYRYVPMLRSKAGEVTALRHLTPQAKQRIFPVFHLNARPPATFVTALPQAWPHELAIDGLFNFAQTGTTAAFISTVSALRQAGATVVPSVEYNADPAYVAAVRRFVTARHPHLVLKAALSHLPHIVAWLNQQNWPTANVDLVIVAGHAADYEPQQFASFVAHALATSLPTPTQWRSVALASSSAPKDYSGLSVGRNDVPRLCWRLWNAVRGQFTNFRLDYGDFGVAHPDLTEPPGIAMAKASVSVRYAIDDIWIVLKGRPTTGQSGQPMGQQYRTHARTLRADPQFDQLTGCWADQRIVTFANGPTTSGSGGRTQWVEIGVNRHLSLVCDRLP